VREFDKPIGRVWRRLRFQRFLAALVWSLGACLTLAVVAVAVEKYARVPLPGADWVPFAVGGGIGLLIAATIALLTGPSRVDAAVAIDRSFHLNERLSTTLTLPEDLRETPAGRALIADTLRHIGDLDIGAKFGLHLPRAAWVPLIPGLMAAGVLLAPEWASTKARATSRPMDAQEQAKVSKQAKSLGGKVEKTRKDLDKSKFGEADKLLAEIEKAADKLAKAPPAEKDKAMVELNKLTDALKDRQKQLGSTQQISKQLQQLKDLTGQGPAEDFAKDMAKGDFAKAAQDLKKLQEKLTSGKMTDAEKKELRGQLEEMKKQLEKLANLEQRKKQLEQAYKNGGLTKDQYEQQMAKLQDQSKQLKKLEQMAQQLAQAGAQLSKNDMKKAADALGASQKELEEMAKQASELETLDQALADLQDAKNGMASDSMNQLGEQLEGMGALGQGNRPGNGNGMGRGRGQGDRPEAADNTNAYNTKVKQQYTKGKVVVEGFAPPSKQSKGESVIIDQERIEQAQGVAAEALSNQKVPKSVEKHVLGYFDQVRKGN
jgi:hypothetical protein